MIRPFQPEDAAAVVALIVGIQRDEFGLEITAADQPDLAMIPEFYQTGGGGFWAAEAAGEVVGTIALKPFAPGQAALRKLFVAPAARGGQRGVAGALLGTLLDHARMQGIADIWLGTTSLMTAAHAFYEKHGFRPVSAADLPADFLLMPVDDRFYHLRL